MKYSALENYIDGSSSPAENAIEVISPVNGEQLSTVPVSGKADLDAAVAAAATAFPAWSQLTIR